ncbi:MAG: hypothetical protein GDA49_02185 [Rhodospirillales bacterium]|nr:hypothetical protein [Rhodospirillales bacterium]
MKRLSLGSGAALLLSAGMARAACPAVTAKDNMGISGACPKQFELAEFKAARAAGDGTPSFSGNPPMADLNAGLHGNPDPSDVADRLPDEPFAIAPTFPGAVCSTACCGNNPASRLA